MIMRKILFLVAAMLIACTSTNQKPKVVTEKENADSRSIRIKKYLEPIYIYYSGQEKLSKKDFNGAIAEFTKIIESCPDFLRGSTITFDIFILRGEARDSLKDYMGAIGDYTRAIDQMPDNGIPYLKRALSKSSLKDFNGAIADFTMSLKFDPNNMWNYYYMGLAKIESGDKSGGCEALRKAADFNDPDAREAIKKYCQ
jgi:tetratricopeptide (TPR) repeat protein